MKKKLMYEVPDAELIELKLENNQMETGSPDGNWDNSIPGETSWGSSSDDYGMES